MCAKVVAPLGSYSASGKIGKALVYFSHLGRNVVRGFVIPANPQSTAQGDVRTVIGGLGRALKIIVTPSDWQVDVKSITPAGQTYGSYSVSTAYSSFMSNVTNYEAMVTELAAHTAAADFETDAVAAGLSSFSLPYAGTTDAFSAGLQLYMLAKLTFALKGSNPSLFDRTVYETALASWTATEIGEFVTDLQTVA